MRKTNGLAKIVMSGLVAAVMTHCIGCTPNAQRPPQKSHNLAYVACKTGEVDIPVEATSQIFTNPDDRIVFVCAGQDLYWKTTNANLTIKVDFKNLQVAPDLFTTGHTSVATDPSNHNQTKKETVKVPKKSLVDYEYTITVDDSSTGAHFSIDPHVIPM